MNFFADFVYSCFQKIFFFLHPKPDFFFSKTDDVFKIKSPRGVMGIFFLVVVGKGRVFDPDVRPSWIEGGNRKKEGGGVEKGGKRTSSGMFLFPPTDPLKPPYTNRKGGDVGQQSALSLLCFFAV